MSNTLEEIKSLIQARPESDQRELLAWLRQRHPIHELETEVGAPAEAISRASDLSRRGVLGLIAEASFKVNVIDGLDGWAVEEIAGDAAYDFVLSRDMKRVSIQVKRQRLVNGQAMRYAGSPRKFVAETQRSRRGVDPRTGEDTRPYRFGEFDILAVCMQPITHDWASFRFTLGRWLLPRPERADWIKVLQPVSLEPNDDWCASLEAAITWFESGRQKTIAI